MFFFLVRFTSFISDVRIDKCIYFIVFVKTMMFFILSFEIYVLDLSVKNTLRIPLIKIEIFFGGRINWSSL